MNSAALACCPNCGLDFEMTRDAKVGDLTINLYGDCWWKGERIKLTPSEATIVFTLAKMAGYFLKHEALENVLEIDSTDPMALIAVFVCRIRTKFRASDPDFNRLEGGGGPVSRGYRWRG